ncbi:MAG TPA: AMP-binding protein [Acidimicrobiales bacterium]|nr:AMP-binding protein [Acidimicrobiales bacterium]
MPRLLAIAVPTGPGFVRELTGAWADGDAVLPVDPRLPRPAVAALLRALRPHLLVDETAEHHRLPDPLPTADGDALVVATSGTTGAPKGVVLTHDAVAASAEASHARLAVDPSTDAWLALLPVAHVGGLSVVTRALATGTPLVFDDDDDERPATLVSLVPTQANRLALDRFRVVLVGGSADWRDRPGNVVRTYGLTETGSGIAYDGVPLDGVEVRVDPDGQLAVRGPMLLRAYRDGTDPKDGDGWLPTGDVGGWDGDGRLVVHGRAGEVIVTGGEKVWPTPVEEALRSHPGVADAAVAGRPDADWGHRVVAFVVPVDAGAPPSLGTLRDHVRRTLPAYAAPRELVLTPGLPRTALGKIRRNLL